MIDSANYQYPNDFQSCMWKVFLLGLQHVNSDSRIAEVIIETGLLAHAPRSKSNVAIADKRVICDGASLDLSASEMTLRVFQAFIDSASGRLNRGDLVKFVYGIRDFDQLSQRRRDSLNHSIVKLVSRARRMADRTLNAGLEHPNDWFIYDSQSGYWKMLRPRDGET